MGVLICICIAIVDSFWCLAFEWYTFLYATNIDEFNATVSLN